MLSKMMNDKILDDFIIIVICTLLLIAINIFFICIKKISASNVFGLFDTLTCIVLLNNWNEKFRELTYMSTILSWIIMIIYLIISTIGMSHIVQANAKRNQQ